MNKSLKNLSDKQLLDVLNATILSYKVYLEENYATNDLIVSEELFDEKKIKASWKKNAMQNAILDQSDPQEMADVIYQFMKFYKDENRETYNKFVDNKSHLYAALYKNDKYTDRIDSYGGYPSQSTHLLASRDVQIELVGKITKAIRLMLDKNIIYGNNNLEQKTAFLDCLGSRLQQDLHETKVTQINEQKFPLNEYRTAMATTALNENFNAIDKSYFLNENYGIFKSKKGKELEYVFDQGFMLIGEKYKHKDTAILANYAKDENGSDVLNISIRGTEGKAKKKSDYFLDDYMNMDRHYDNLEIPMERIIQKAMTEHKGNTPLKVNLYGHSLGAAMVEKFLSTHSNYPDIEYSAVCIASPGGIHQFPNLITFLDNTKLRPLIPVFNAGLAGVNGAKLGVKKLTNQFLSVGAYALDKTISLMYEKEPTAESVEEKKGLYIKKIDPRETDGQDPRILFVKNSTDLIPQIGRLLYESPETSVILNDKYPDSMLESHKMFNYYDQIIKEVKARPQLKDKLQNLLIVEEAIEGSRHLKKLTDGDFISSSKEVIKGKISLLRENAEKQKNTLVPHERKLNGV